MPERYYHHLAKISQHPPNGSEYSSTRSLGTSKEILPAPRLTKRSHSDSRSDILHPKLHPTSLLQRIQQLLENFNFPGFLPRSPMMIPPCLPLIFLPNHDPHRHQSQFLHLTQTQRRNLLPQQMPHVNKSLYLKSPPVNIYIQTPQPPPNTLFRKCSHKPFQRLHPIPQTKRIFPSVEIPACFSPFQFRALRTSKVCKDFMILAVETVPCFAVHKKVGEL